MAGLLLEAALLQFRRQMQVKSHRSWSLRSVNKISKLLFVLLVVIRAAKNEGRRWYQVGGHPIGKSHDCSVAIPKGNRLAELRRCLAQLFAFNSVGNTATMKFFIE